MDDASNRSTDDALTVIVRKGGVDVFHQALTLPGPGTVSVEGFGEMADNILEQAKRLAV